MLDKDKTKVRNIKFVHGGGIDIDYVTVLPAEGGSDDTMEVRRKFATPEDIDFDDTIDKLKPHIVRDNYMLGAGLLGIEIEDLSESDRKLLDEIYRKIEIDKVTVSGKYFHIIKIQARMSGMYGNIKVFNAGPFSLRGNNRYAYAEDLETVLAELENEAIMFLNQVEFKLGK